MSAGWLDEAGQALWDRARAFVAAGDVAADDFDAFACELFRWQRAHDPVLARLAARTLARTAPERAADVPAVPTDVFAAARVASFDERFTVRSFASSGTTRDVPGVHRFADLSLYAEACVATAAQGLLPAERYRCAFLAEDERDAPRSSLSFMLARFAERWHDAPTTPWMLRAGKLDVDGVVRALQGDQPVALLGTSFAFVHLLDAARSPALRLPAGSVVMPTGGFKGRSRELAPEAFRAALVDGLGVPEASVVGEYGMTELSSQAYEQVRNGRRAHHPPPWMRVRAVDPSTLAELPPGVEGLLRVVDLLNIGSAVAIQTSDVGRVAEDGSFVVLGRAPGATPRGCARAADAALRGED